MDENEPSKATPDSGAGDDANQNQSATKTPAVKDKECPYCHQPFTSSSLGRHLDQYLTKKKPDGIHDVDEIKRLRGGITRRQPKGTHAAKQDPHPEESAAANESPATIQCSPSADYLNGVCEGGHITSLNTPIWQSTGVINGLPDPRAGIVGGAVQPINNFPPLKRTTPSSSTQEPPPEKETARALELALREVLENIRSASIRTAPKPSPFDFDLQAQTFPSLCLRLLPPPPTLFSSGPFSTPDSFPIEPPGASHLESVRAKALSIIAQWKDDHLSALNSTLQSNEPPDPSRIESIARQHSEMASRHIEIAYHNWMKSESNIQRYEQWLAEILRAFSRERLERQDAAERLVRVQEEADQLQSQVDLLSKCQWPREYAFFPPCRAAVGSSLGTDGVRELNAFSQHAHLAGVDVGDSPWDYDAIVSKWKRIIREESARTTGAIAAQQQPPMSSHSPIDSSNSNNIHHRPHPHPPQQHHPSHSHTHAHPHFHPRPGSSGSPSEPPSISNGGRVSSNSMPAAKKPRLAAPSVTTTTTNGTSAGNEAPDSCSGSGSGSVTFCGPGNGGGNGSSDGGEGPGGQKTPMSIVRGVNLDTGPLEAPFFGRRSLKEVRF